MSLNRSTFFQWTAAGVVATGALFAAASSANAATSLSFGINLPGAPVYYEPAPVYAVPPPVYYEPPAPRVYYRPPPPVYYRPAPTYYAAPPIYYGPRYRKGKHHHDEGDWEDHDD